MSFSGWEERDGGERSRVRGSELDFDVIAEEGLKSGVVSRVTAGAMVSGKIAVAERTSRARTEHSRETHAMIPKSARKAQA